MATIYASQVYRTYRRDARVERTFFGLLTETAAPMSGKKVRQHFTSMVAGPDAASGHDVEPQHFG